MSAQFNISKKDTSINLSQSDVAQKVRYNGEERHKKRKRRWCKVRNVILGVLLLVLCGFIAETYQLMRMEERMERKSCEDQKSFSSLEQIIKNNSRKLAELESSFLDQLIETDDPNTANQKLLRRVRALSTNVGECDVSRNGGKCNYTETIAFFYTSHHVLRESKNFTREENPALNFFRCGKQMVNPRTGQVWCKNDGRADDFYNRFPQLQFDPNQNPDEFPWPYLNQSAIMMEPGAGWTDLSHHEYYGLEDGTRIKVKQSGLYMLFASVNFDVYKGSSVSYGLRKNNAVLKGCSLTAQTGSHDTGQMESCFIFLVSYFNKGDFLTMTISGGTKFLLGETNFYIGLYHLTSVEIAVPNSTK